jgi:peptidoglycan/xylan/chitin deacetylase (PgdA/CDA1 family)
MRNLRIGHRTHAVWQTIRHRRAAPGGVVLGYHDVVADDATPGRWGVTVGQLRRHLRVLEAMDLRIVGLDEIARRLDRGESLDRCAALTFDDALSGVHTQALEVIAEAGATATVFVVSDHLGTSPPWWPGAARTLDTTEIDALVRAGWTIGSHTRHHPNLVACGESALVDELAGSRRCLAERFGTAPELLAYPHGYHDTAVRKAAAESGYTAAVTFLNGRVTAGVDPMRIPRLTMGAHLGAARLTLHLARVAGSWPDHQLDRVGPDERAEHMP